MPLCPYCQHPCKSERGLRQHIDSRPTCSSEERKRLGIRSNTSLLSQAISNRNAPSRSELMARTIQLTGGVGGGSSLYRSIVGRRGNGSGLAAIPSESRRSLSKKRSQGGVTEQQNPRKKKKTKTTSTTRDPEPEAIHPQAHTGQSTTTTMHDLLQAQRGTMEDATSFLQEIQTGNQDNLQGNTPQSGATTNDSGTSENGNSSPQDDDDDAPLQFDNASHEDNDQEQVEENSNHNEEVAVTELREFGQCPHEYAGDASDDWNNDNNLNVNINTEMRASFKAFCERHGREMLPWLSKEQQQGIRLLDILKRKKAPMDAYKEVMLWHFQSTGLLAKDESLIDLDKGNYIGRQALIKYLQKRYNMSDKFASQRLLTLPYSQQHIELVCHDAWGCLESLLTDPRVTDDDYLFFANDPTAEPPEQIEYYEDLNTGLAYRAAVKKYKQGVPKRVVIPICLYIDGADTGTMKNMPVTAVKMALGIHKSKYRERDQAWRILGYVASVKKPKAQGKKILEQSEHIAGVGGTNHEQIPPEGGADEQNESDAPAPLPTRPVDEENGKPSDFHAMLDVILEGLVEVVKRGFMWDLRYRGKTWKDLEFIPYISFVKCDNKEADTLCGAYNNYGKGVAHLCRYCHCPNEESDNPEARWRFKTVPEIKTLVALEDLPGLKAISQHCIQNAMHKLRFSPISLRGIHGATPSELLHQVLLGIFKYVRDTFYEQVGPDSKAAELVDNLSQLFGGEHFARQSERDMPYYKCTDGIREGKVQAKEFRAILLVMALICRCATARIRLVQKDKKLSRQELDDWAELLEILLFWEAFLGQPKISVDHISKLATRNRYLMWMLRKTADRQAGRGLRIIKFHTLLHMALDISLYGVPMELDTGSNESGHKLTKVASLLTQKIGSLFEWQTAIRLSEFLLIELGIAEMDGFKLWDYYDQPPRPGKMSPKPLESDVSTGETRINVFRNQEEKVCYSFGSGKEAEVPIKRTWDADVLAFLDQLQQNVSKWIPNKLHIRSEHRRGTQIYRGHPHYRGKPWKDWVLLDWGGQEPEPAQIWCFVVLSGLPKSRKKQKKHKDKLQYGGELLRDGVFAVIECAPWKKPTKKMVNTRIFRQLTLEMAANTAGSQSTRRRFYLADVKKIKGPLFVVPDVGCQNKRDYFAIRSRREWVSVCEKWLEEPLPEEYNNDRAGLQFGLSDR